MLGAWGLDVLLGDLPAARCVRVLCPVGYVSLRSVGAISAPVPAVRGSRWMRPAGRWSPCRRLVGGSVALVVGRRHTGQLLHAQGQRQADGPRPAGEVGLTRTGSAAGRTAPLVDCALGARDGLAVDPDAADGVHDLVVGAARCRPLRVHLVQVEAVEGGIAFQQGEQRQLQRTVRAAAGFQSRPGGGPSPGRRFWPARFRNHSSSLDHRLRPAALRTAMAMAFFCPTSTTRRLPRVTPV